MNWRGLADRKQQFVADQWQYTAVGLIHRRKAPRHGLVDFGVQAAAAGVGGERLFERAGLEGFGQCRSIQKRHVGPLSQLRGGGMRGVADVDETVVVGAG